MVKKLHIKEDLDSNLRKQKDIKSDIRKIASIDPDVTTYEDLKQINFLHSFFTKTIKDCEKKGLSVEDCIDYVIEDSREWLKWIQNDYNEKVEYDKKVNALIPVLDNFLNTNYTVIDEDKTNEGVIWTIKAPENADYDDCIAFVDSIVDVVNGRYYITGRGGSWSRWNILTNGVEFKAGWKAHTDNWEVEISYRRSTF